MPTYHSFEFPFEFDADERRVGDELAGGNAVTLSEEGKNGFFEAEVRHFGRNVWTWMRAKDDRSIIGHGCDCSHFENTGKGCEHLWALIRTLGGDDAADAGSTELRPTYLIHPRSSERERRLVLSILADDFSPLAMTHENWARIDDDADVDAIRLIGEKSGGWVPVKSGGGFVQKNGPYRPDVDATRAVLEAMLATTRAFVGEETGVPGVALRSEIASPAEFELSLMPKADGQIEISGRLHFTDGGTRSLDAVDSVVLGAFPFCFKDGALMPIETFGANEWFEKCRSGLPPRMPKSGAYDILADLARTHPLPRLHDAATDAHMEVVRVPPRGRISILRKGSQGILRLDWLYGAGVVTAGTPGRLVFDRTAMKQIWRDAAAENDLVNELLETGADPDADSPATYYYPTSRLPQLVDALASKGFDLLLDDRRTRRTGKVSFRLRGTTDWFEIDGEITADGLEASLVSVLAAIKGGRDFVELSDGSAALIDPDDRRRLENLARFLGDEGSSLRLDGARALLVDGILGQKNVDRDQKFQDLRRHFETFGGVARVSDPEGLQTVLRPYQSEGLAWIGFLESSGLGGCLADDMGLGKTIQVIAALLSRRSKGPSGAHLVVVPRSLVANWQLEIARFAPELDVVVHSGKERLAGEWPCGTVVITTYGILRRDVEDLERTTFDYLVLDEAQAIKNADSQTATCARRLKARRRLALTGTPIENTAAELWSILEFANPGLFGSESTFTDAAEDGDDAVRAALKRALKPVLLRRTKDMVAKDLPELIEQVVVIDMTEEQQRVYDRLRHAAAAQIGGKTEGPRDSAFLLEALLRLRQIACHPGLAGEEAENSGKLELLLERLSELRASGRKALVFSQFTRLLGLAKRQLDAAKIRYAYLDGSTTDRAYPVRVFQEDPRCTAFLISLRAGGVGLNLTAADVVFILDPWWNPAVEAQAIARAHRIGRKSSVLAQRLVSRGTVEEAMLELQKKKADLAATFTDQTGDLEGITQGELSQLLTFGAS